MTNDLSFYERALKEVDEKRLVSTLWAKAFADADGDPNQAKARYIKLRVADLNLRRREDTHAGDSAARLTAPWLLPRDSANTGDGDVARKRPRRPALVWSATLAGVIAIIAFAIVSSVDLINRNEKRRERETQESIDRTTATALRGVKEEATTSDPSDTDAQSNLGLTNHNSDGAPQDYSEAVKWARNAADQSLALAHSNPVGLYEKDQGIPKDPTEAANHGDANAQYYVGLTYYRGEGVSQNYAEAAKWFRKAAAQGHANAQTNLGVIYGIGQGVRHDYVESMKWFNLATSGYPATLGEDRGKAFKTRDLVASEMTPAQLAEAQRLASEWKPN